MKYGGNRVKLCARGVQRFAQAGQFHSTELESKATMHSLCKGVARKKLRGGQILQLLM